MKTVTNLYRGISDPEKNKSQFVDSMLPKILMVNPMLNQQEFYQMIFPALLMNTFEVATVAFTGISKFESKKTQPSYATEMEIRWADSIVFPFTVLDLSEEINQCREINPDIKVVYFVDCEFWNHQFSRTIGIIPGKQNEILDRINAGVLNNILCSDRIVVHSESLKESLKKWLIQCDVESYVIDRISIISLHNDEALLNEGITELPKHQHRNPDEIRVFVECLDEHSARMVFKNIEAIYHTPHHKKTKFYTRWDFPKNHLIEKIPSISLQHSPKEFHANQYDYCLIAGKGDQYNKHRFLSGLAIEMMYFGAIPVFSTPFIYESQPWAIRQISESMLMSDFFRMLNEEVEADYNKRIELGIKIRNIDLFESDESIANEYANLFLILN